jgi:hypothetical protein
MSAWYNGIFFMGSQGATLSLAMTCGPKNNIVSKLCKSVFVN